jgi:hypothetical protein
MSDFFCTKRNGKPVYDPAVKAAKEKAWDKIPEGKTVNLPVTVPIDGKSHAQCKLIFGNMITNAVHQANEKAISTEKMMKYLLLDDQRNIPNGVPVDKNFLHAFMYQISPTFSEDGKPVTLSDMDTIQASRLFKVVQIFLANMGIIIEDPPEIKETK